MFMPRCRFVDDVESKAGDQESFQSSSIQGTGRASKFLNSIHAHEVSLKVYGILASCF